jgi:hypothetical protein
MRTMVIKNESVVDEVSEKVGVITLVDRDIIKTDVTDEKDVIFPANSLLIIVDHRY